MLRNIISSMYQLTGKRYPDLEKLLQTVDHKVLSDLLRFIRDVEDAIISERKTASRRIYNSFY